MERITKHVVWTKRARKDTSNVLQFYTKIYGFSKAKHIVEKLRIGVDILESPDIGFDRIGVIDEEFAHLKGEYRKLIDNHIKITYRIGKTKIYIVRVFDMRQNPNKNL